MGSKRKVTGKALSLPGAIAIGLGVNIILTVIGSAIIAWLIIKGSVGESSLGYGSMAVLILSSAIGSAVANSIYKQKKLMVSGISAAVYYLTLLGMTTSFFGGQYAGMGVTALMVLLGSSLNLIPTPQGKGKKFKHKIPAYR